MSLNEKAVNKQHEELASSLTQEPLLSCLKGRKGHVAVKEGASVVFKDLVCLDKKQTSKQRSDRSQRTSSSALKGARCFEMRGDPDGRNTSKNKLGEEMYVIERDYQFFVRV